MPEPPTDLQPTDDDRDRAAMREAIAARQQAEYDQCLAWARAAFGAGWLPSHRHMLIEKTEEERSRREGTRAVPSAVVYTARQRRTGEARHFTVEDGKPIPCASMEEGFGAMLLEPDTTSTIEVRGQQVHPQRFSLCWAGYDTYKPRSAEQLATLRVSRERGKAERTERKWAEDNPLLANAGIKAGDLKDEEKGPGR